MKLRPSEPTILWHRAAIAIVLMVASFFGLFVVLALRAQLGGFLLALSCLVVFALFYAAMKIFAKEWLKGFPADFDVWDPPPRKRDWWKK